MTCHAVHIAVHNILIPVEFIVRRKLHQRHHILFLLGISCSSSNDFTYIIHIGTQCDYLREISARDNLHPFFIFIFPKQIFRFVQMSNLLNETLFPYAAYSRVTFCHHTGIIQIALCIFMHQQIFQPGSICIFQTFILAHMLFFDHADFLIQSPAQI